MKTRSTHRGLELTEIGLGTAQFGNQYRETTDAEAEEGVGAAGDAEVRYFDTAPHNGLGLSERRLGEQLRSHSRDEYMISSKMGKLLVPNPGAENPMDDESRAVPASSKRGWDFSPEASFDYDSAPSAILERANRVADACETHDLTLPEGLW